MDFLRRPLPYRAEYAPSGWSRCRYCDKYIKRKCLRMCLNKYKYQKWHHFQCFLEMYEENSGNRSEEHVLKIENIEHFAHLRHEDQIMIRERINGRQLEDNSINGKLEEQSNQLYSYFDELDRITVPDINILLDFNGIRISRKIFSRIYTLADAMTFGVPEMCPECKEANLMRGQLVFRVCGYICSMGALTEHLNCFYCTLVSQHPKRTEFKIPEELKNEFQFLRDYIFEERERQYIPELETAYRNFNKKPNFGENNSKRSGRQFKEFIEENEPDYHRIDYFSDYRAMGDQHNRRLTNSLEVISAENKLKRELNLFLKEGYAVDPDSGHNYDTHIYEGHDAVLTSVQLNENRNSFYKIQLLEEDGESDHKKYYVFRKWGRIGDNYSFKTFSHNSLDSALKMFNEVFKMKTGLDWTQRKGTKIPRKYYYLDIENFKTGLILKSIKTKATKHSKRIKDLICELFDAQKMRNYMFELKIDCNQMPLGMVSKQQLSKTKKNLIYLRKLIEDNSEDEREKRHLSIKFYQNIPHISSEPLPPIKTLKQVEDKLSLVEDLRNMKLAYEMLCPQNYNKPIKDPIDYLYRKLNISIESMNRNSLEFKEIEKYVKNGEVHDFRLEVANIFRIKKNDSFEENMKNKQKLLLWHGSHITNVVGILSKGFLTKGLDPGVKIDGKLFGPGIYLADLVSKSGQYCYKRRGNRPTERPKKVLLFLCEVVSNNMRECIRNDEEIGNDVDCIKWIGETGPDPDGAALLPNNPNTYIPVGPLIPQYTENETGSGGPLKYNEYLVRNPKNIGFKYLVECYFEQK